MIEIIIDSFRELLLKIKELFIKYKVYIYRIIGFLILCLSIYLLSFSLTKISFLDKIDLTDPRNVAELQPIVNVRQRNIGLIALIISFFALVSFIGKWQGFGSFLGLGLSIFTIYKLMIPLLLLGWNPLLVTLIGGTIVITGTIYFSHGFEWKSTVALIGALSSVIVTLLLGEIFRYWIQVSGYYGEAVYNLLAMTQRNFDIGGIVLGGIVLAGIGLLDDMTVTQSSVIKEIVNTDPKLSIRKIYFKAMNVGKDHIGAVVNSLFWAYAATTLPLLMLLSYTDTSLTSAISLEFMMEDVLRIIVSSMGLVLSIPFTTIIGAIVFKRLQKQKGNFTN